MILERNLLIEAVLPVSIQRQLIDTETDEYRRPFARPAKNRRPTLTWPREIPGESADVVEIVNHYSAATSTHVRQLENAEPGAILTRRQRDDCRSWPNQTEVTVPGIHCVQEDSGDLIGGVVASWLGA